jgi:phosphoserine phosphatase
MSAEAAEKSTIAVIFDFDDTIAPDSTTRLLEDNGVDSDEFWTTEFPKLVHAGYDPTIAYLSLLLEHVADGGVLAGLSNEDLAEVGEDLSDDVFTGFQDLINDLEKIADGYASVEIEFYIISEGLYNIIAATDIADRFNAIYASELDKTDGSVDRIKRAISFTDKTRYLFEINKGISPADARENPYLVNSEIPKRDRHVPFENMIYVGDGLTDIPCFSLVKDRHGRAFGVYDADEPSPKQRAIQSLGSQQRTLGSVNPPHYGEESRLGSLLRLTVEGMCAERTIEGLEALSGEL